MSLRASQLQEHQQDKSEVSYTVTVTYSGANHFAYSSSGGNNPIVTVGTRVGFQAPVGKSRFTLNLAIGPGVTYAEYITAPVQWVNSRFELIAAPTGVTVQRVSVRQLVITVDNTNPGPGEISENFFLIILSDQMIASDDPILIELPPGGV